MYHASIFILNIWTEKAIYAYKLIGDRRIRFYSASKETDEIKGNRIRNWG